MNFNLICKGIGTLSKEIVTKTGKEELVSAL